MSRPVWATTSRTISTLTILGALLLSACSGADNNDPTATVAPTETATAEPSPTATATLEPTATPTQEPTATARARSMNRIA